MKKKPNPRPKKRTAGVEVVKVWVRPDWDQEMVDWGCCEFHETQPNDEYVEATLHIPKRRSSK